jgi:phage baseplate assembly protein W
MAYLAHPFHFDGRGRTACVSWDDHIRDLIEQVLFTAPGERVNRPTFGSGMLKLAFEPNSAALGTATRLAVQGALQQWLGDVIRVEEVRVDVSEATIGVTVQYSDVKTQQRRVAEFTRKV